MNGLGDVGIATRMTGAGHMGRTGREFFPDPWLDMASQEMPKSLMNVLQWAEFIWLTNGTYRMACERVVRYFLTKIEVLDADDDQAEEYKDFLENTLKAIDMLALLGDDHLCYGNSFSSLLAPFDRFLACPRCRLERPIERVIYEFTKDYQFKGLCPKCAKVVNFERHDRKSNNDKEFKLIRWSPHYMLIQYNEITHDCEYRYRIPEEVKRKVRAGDKFVLRTTPWEMIDAIQQDKLFRFDRDRIYHMKEPTLAGFRSMGWGIPRLIANFKQAYYIQVLKRYNEALAIDYIVPFRVMTPVAGNSRTADPLLHQNLGSARAQVMSMIAEHRRDPATYHFLPFPMDYKALGGEGAQMATHELINAATDEMLNAQGIPSDLYKGSLQLQVAPTALRLFERTWPQVVSNNNGWLCWIMQAVASAKNWEPARGRMQPVTLADDMEKKQILLQLAAAKEVSRTTAYGPFGIDMRDELKRIYEEERQKSELEREFQREEADRAQMEQTLAAVDQSNPGSPAGMAAQAAGGMQGGAPMAAGQGAPMGGGAMPQGAPAGGAGQQMTPQNMLMQADQIAQQLLQMPYEARKSQMLQLKRTDEALHALVKSKMEQQRGQASAAGRQMLQQQGGAGPTM